MRPLIAMSLAVLIFGLALGLLNLYIIGRIDAPILIVIIGLIALVTASLARR